MEKRSAPWLDKMARPTANTATCAAANAPDHPAAQYATARTTAYATANANGRRHAAANFIDRPNTIAKVTIPFFYKNIFSTCGIPNIK